MSKQTAPTTYHIEQLIEAYGKLPTNANLRRIMYLIHQRELETEKRVWKQVRKSYPKKKTEMGLAKSRLTLADVDREIGKLTQPDRGGSNE